MVTAAIGVVLILVMATFDYRFLKVYAGFIYAGIVVALLLVRVPFLGSSQAGAQRWFEVAGFQITPSEFAKLGLIVMLAASLSEMKHALPSVQDMIRLCGVALVPLMLVFIQPDIGTSIVMVAIAAGMFLVAGVSGRHLAALVVICLVLIAAAFQLGVIKEYQLDRLRAFLDRENTPGRRPIQPRPGGDRGRQRRALRPGIPPRPTDDPRLRARAAHRLHLHGRRGGVRVPGFHVRARRCTPSCSGGRSGSRSCRRIRSARTWRRAWRSCSRSRCS